MSKNARSLSLSHGRYDRRLDRLDHVAVLRVPEQQVRQHQHVEPLARARARFHVQPPPAPRAAAPGPPPHVAPDLDPAPRLLNRLLQRVHVGLHVGHDVHVRVIRQHRPPAPQHPAHQRRQARARAQLQHRPPRHQRRVALEELRDRPRPVPQVVRFQRRLAHEMHPQLLPALQRKITSKNVGSFPSSQLPPPQIADRPELLANSFNISIVPSSLSLYSRTLSSLSAILALQISSRRASLSDFFFSWPSRAFFAASSDPSSPAPISVPSSTSAPGDRSRNSRILSFTSRFFSSLRSRLPGSARGTSSSRRSFCSRRSSLRACRICDTRSARSCADSSATSSSRSLRSSRPGVAAVCRTLLPVPPKYEGGGAGPMSESESEPAPVIRQERPKRLEIPLDQHPRPQRQFLHRRRRRRLRYLPRFAPSFPPPPPLRPAVLLPITPRRPLPLRPLRAHPLHELRPRPPSLPRPLSSPLSVIRGGRVVSPPLLVVVPAGPR
ncbi:unnamed protein product [Parascedosporium putredinis]|uniref:Uncharacterized protein n=1 Tax=Parascedosporium putredinis TaxID=1442378 RepID=A0A9P1HB43_9PEZI|nr:unnamed protein product [Parascedosporium putredinis]CAI8005132.1 unnamed protein product [Parascedosporium putredinis]